MKFECDNCSAQYMIADEKLGARGVKVKCKRCSHVIIVRPVSVDAGGVDVDEEQTEMSASAEEPSFDAGEDSAFGDDDVGQEDLDAFGNEFDGASERATAETPEFGGDTEVAPAFGDTEVAAGGDDVGDEEPGDLDDEEPPPPDRTMVTPAPLMTQGADEDDAPAPPPQADAADDDDAGDGFSDPLAGGADPFAGLDDAVDGAFPDSDDADGAFAGSDDEGGAFADSDQPGDAFGDMGDDGEEAQDPFGDNAATDDELSADDDDDGEPPTPPAAEPPAPAAFDGLDASESEVPVPPPADALPEAPSFGLEPAPEMPDAGVPSDMLDNELAGAFSAMFDPASGSAGADAGGGQEESDPRGATKVLDLGAVDELRAESARTTEGPGLDAPFGGLDDLRADLDSSLGDEAGWGAAGAPSQEEAEPEWHVAIDDEDVGPLSLKQISEHINNGEVDRDTLAWKPGLDDWEPCGDIADLQTLFAASPMPSIAGGVGAFDVGAPIDDLNPSPFGGGEDEPVADPFSAVGAGEFTTEEPDPSWQPHGLTEVYQAANLAEAAGGLGGGGGGAPAATSGALDDEDDAGWKPGAANALASLVANELDGLGTDGASGEMSLPPAADDSLNTAFGAGALTDIGSPPGLGDIDTLDSGAGHSGSDDPLGAPLGGGMAMGGGAQTLGGGMPMAPYASGAQPLHKNPVVLIGAAAGLVIMLLLVVIIFVVARPDPAPVVAAAPAVPVAPAPAAPAPAVAAPAAAPAAEPPPAAPEPAVAAAAPAAEKPVKVASAPKPTTRRPRTTKPPKAVDEPKPKPKPPRGDCDPILDLDCPEKGGGGGGGRAKKATLSPTDVLGVVRKNLRTVNRCGSKHGVSGTVRMEWRILKSGRTSSVRVMTPKYAGTPVGKCMISAIKKWKFPAFTGSPPPPVKFPFKLKG